MDDVDVGYFGCPNFGCPQKLEKWSLFFFYLHQTLEDESLARVNSYLPVILQSGHWLVLCNTVSQLVLCFLLESNQCHYYTWLNHRVPHPMAQEHYYVNTHHQIIPLQSSQSQLEFNWQCSESIWAIMTMISYPKSKTEIADRLFDLPNQNLKLIQPFDLKLVTLSF
ncbi:hypothetical protein BD560DRAFT_491078 [Blakeslea trispora]|nr:hypothetical protein BD560DRAFT_491078 [Blakeslea trispora]